MGRQERERERERENGEARRGDGRGIHVVRSIEGVVQVGTASLADHDSSRCPRVVAFPHVRSVRALDGSGIPPKRSVERTRYWTHVRHAALTERSPSFRLSVGRSARRDGTGLDWTGLDWADADDVDADCTTTERRPLHGRDANRKYVACQDI